MRKRSTTRRSGGTQSGAALLIAIFALLLISVVAIAMIVSQGTDSALAGNYRTSTSAYYSAVAGLEEVRGRLFWKNPDYINKSGSYSSLLSPTGVPSWSLTQVLYITNPASGETVDPTSSNPAQYPDTEYSQEFPGWGLSGAVVQTPLASVWTSASTAGPSYKWVRINPVTEASLNIDVDNDGAANDGVDVLFYDPAHMDTATNKPSPSLILSNSPGSPPVPPTTTAVQALEVTALAVMPNGSKRLLQYVVVPLAVATQPSSLVGTPSLPAFPAALTLAGNGANFTAPTPGGGGGGGSDIFFINGQDQCAGSNPLAYSIAYTNNGDGVGITAAATPASNYKGAPAGAGGPPPPPTSPGIGYVNANPANPLMRQSWQTPAGLDAVVQDITKSADIVMSGPANGNLNLTPLGMSALNPMTVVVNGDLDLTSWHQVGYGLLVVTGTLTYDPDATWEGVVLVIGQGKFVSTRSGTGGIDGAVFVAKTRDGSGNLLASLGAASFIQTGDASSSGRGINYNSCLINAAAAGGQVPLGYKVLSFREIPTN
jgi:hypothetical protein